MLVDTEWVLWVVWVRGMKGTLVDPDPAGRGKVEE